MGRSGGNSSNSNRVLQRLLDDCHTMGEESVWRPALHDPSHYRGPLKSDGSHHDMEATAALPSKQR